MVDEHEEEQLQFENIIQSVNTAIPPVQNNDMPSTSKTVTLAQVLAKLEQIEVNQAVLKKQNEGMEEKIKIILALLNKHQTAGRFNTPPQVQNISTTFSELDVAALNAIDVDGIIASTIKAVSDRHKAITDLTTEQNQLGSMLT